MNAFKVIAIKLPFDLQERLLSFPLLHALREKYPDSEMHFITPRKEIEVLNLLPFKAYYHEFDDGEIKTIFDVHRFSANAKIYNVDLFINLTNSFVDSCLGVSLRARTRLGFSDGWKTLTLNLKTPRLSGQHVCEEFFHLYETLTGEEVNQKLKVVSRELSSILPETGEGPYLAVNLSPLRGEHLDHDYVDLLNRFKNQRIVLFSSEDQIQVQNILAPFAQRLSKQNTYVNFVYKNTIELARMLSFARGVITHEGPLASLSAYVGTNTLIMYERRDPQREGPFYFLAEVLVTTSKTPDMSDVAGRALEFFKLGAENV